MKKIDILEKINRVVFFAFLCASCDNPEKEKVSYRIDPQFSREWKKDSMGCLGFRFKHMHDTLFNVSRFINAQNTDFLENFGKPYESRIGTDGEINNIYFMGCALRPKPIRSGKESAVDYPSKINNESPGHKDKY